MNTVGSTAWQARTRWIKARSEILIPILGLPLFFGMIGWMDVRLTAVQSALVWGAALIYTVLVLWAPMSLPPKECRPVSWAAIRRSAAIVTVAVVGAVLLQAVLHRPTGRSDEGGEALLLLLCVVLGTAGVAAERTLPIDLFPVLRRREVRRILYTIVAALFLTTLLQLWGGILDGLARGIGAALGEVPPESGGAVSYFAGYNPASLFVVHLISAGFEELLFRTGIMTSVWALTGRWGIGLLVSALCFGVYHVTLSGMSDYFATAAVIAVVSHFGAGLANGVVYRYRGFATAVLVHGLGNWLLLLLLAGPGVS